MAASRSRPKKTRRTAGKKKLVRTLSHAQVPAAVKTMTATSGTARFGAGKTLAATAAKDPARVYPHFDQIAALLDGESKVVRWNALQIIAALAPADAAGKLDAVLDRYLAFIQGDNLISAANAIQGAGRIAQCRPDLLDRIIPAILDVQHATYDTPECRNVAIGHALNVLAGLGPTVRRRPDVLKFTRRQTTNPRAAVARSAKGMLTNL